VTPQSGAEVKREWSCTSTPLYAYMTCRDIFVFPFLFVKQCDMK